MGEFVTSGNISASLTSGSTYNFTLISLTAGDWDVDGAIQYVCSVPTLTDAYVCASTTSLDTSQSNMALSLAIDEGLRDLQEIDWTEQHRLLASEFGETGGGEFDGLPALQDRFDQPRAHKGEKIVVMAPTDVSELRNLTRTGAEQLRRAGIR